MTGDAFGFVDPMLSPGMWLALRSAELLAEKLDDLPAYTREMRKLIKAWMELIEYFYDGRMFAMYHTGSHFEQAYPGKISDAIKTYVNRLIALMASGAYGLIYDVDLPLAQVLAESNKTAVMAQEQLKADAEVLASLHRQIRGRRTL